MDSFTLIGTDGVTYTVLVRAENSNGFNEDAVGTSTVTADGSVSPAPDITDFVGGGNGNDDGLTFSWSDDAVGSDVDSWMICWSASQSVVEDDFGDLVSAYQQNGDSCAATEDTTTSLKISELTICGAPCATKLYFGIAGVDEVGNVDSGSDKSDAMVAADFSAGVVEPPVIPGEEDDGDGIPWSDDLCPSDWGNATSSLGCPDQDGDGWADIDETCPAVWGDAINRAGCPDTDGDELADQDDGCPLEAGTSIHPIIGCPDDDSDGWANANDTFPTNPTEWNDADADGVGDNMDECPNTPDTTVDRRGCPLPDEDSNILFYASVGAGGLTGASLLFFMLPRMMRRMNSEEALEEMKRNDKAWQGQQSIPEGPPLDQPQCPSANIQGSVQPDGFEYLQWPNDSEDWWYRQQSGLDWSRWERN
jgi:hypothetical protein